MSDGKRIRLDQSVDFNESLYDQFIEDINPVVIPVEYIYKMIIVYESGVELEIMGNEISEDVDIRDLNKWKSQRDGLKRVDDIKFYIDTKKLEQDVDALMFELFGTFYQ